MNDQPRRDRAHDLADVENVDAVDVDCQDLVEWTTEYFEGTLPAIQARRLESHLTECDGCTEYLRQMRATQDALGRPDATVVPAAGRERLLATFRNWKAGEGAA